MYDRADREGGDQCDNEDLNEFRHTVGVEERSKIVNGIQEYSPSSMCLDPANFLGRLLRIESGLRGEKNMPSRLPVKGLEGRGRTHICQGYCCKDLKTG